MGKVSYINIRAFTSHILIGGPPPCCDRVGSNPRCQAPPTFLQPIQIFILAAVNLHLFFRNTIRSIIIFPFITTLQFHDGSPGRASNGGGGSVSRLTHVHTPMKIKQLQFHSIPSASRPSSPIPKHMHIFELPLLPRLTAGLSGWVF